MTGHRSTIRTLPAAVGLLALVAVSAVGLRTCFFPPADARFNVVLLLLDTTRADRLPPYGAPERDAPYMASLGSRGVVFEHAISPSSWTAPATASIFTGTYPNQHGVYTGLLASEQTRIRINRIPEAAETLPIMMRRAGYRTFGVSGNANIDHAMGFAAGFDRFIRPDDNRAESLNATVASWSEEIRSSEPYFLYVHYMDPHAPYTRHAGWEPGAVGTAYRQALEAEGVHVPDDRLEDRVESYASEIRYLDRHLAKLHDLLGWNQNTLVVLTADHGEAFGEHGAWGHGFEADLHGEVIRVPLLFFLPARFPPHRIADVVSTLDLLPTLRRLVGGPQSTTDQGIDLTRLLDGEDDHVAAKRFVFSMQYFFGAPRVAAVRDRWKYIYSPYAGGRFYDIGSDRFEQRDLLDHESVRADDYREAITRLLETPPRWNRQFVVEQRSDALNARLRSLGYVE